MNILEQLKSVLCDPSGKCCITGSDEDRAIVDRALQALAEQSAQQEPLLREIAALSANALDDYKMIQKLMAERQPLTDEEIEAVWDSTLSEDVGITALRKSARAIEAAHGIKCNELEQPAQQQEADHEFKNFHRILCERFGYTHDERDWKRDQVSLIEWIAKKVEQPAQQEPVAWCIYCDGQFTHNIYRVEDLANFRAAALEEEYPKFKRKVVPLYTAPQKHEWVNLTKEEVDSWELPDCPTVFEFVQFIEDKIKEKNNG